MLASPPTELLSSLSKIKVARLAMNPLDGAKIHFELDTHFREVSRGKGKIKLGYTLTIDTVPVVQRATVEGFATVDETLVHSDDGAALNELALSIFKQHYEPLYLLFDTLSLASPSPWMVREVRLVERS